MLVSATEDKYSADACNIEAQAREVYRLLDAEDRLVHQRYNGGHAITEERFVNILNWTVQIVNEI